jgi:hypothetical protein
MARFMRATHGSLGIVLLSTWFASQPMPEERLNCKYTATSWVACMKQAMTVLGERLSFEKNWYACVAIANVVQNTSRA